MRVQVAHAMPPQPLLQYTGLCQIGQVPQQTSVRPESRGHGEPQGPKKPPRTQDRDRKKPDRQSHHPYVENMGVALRGINAGLTLAGEDAGFVEGVAIYANWTTDSREWKTYRDLWLNPVAIEDQAFK